MSDALLELLRAADPVAPADLPGPEDAAMAAMLDAIIAGVEADTVVELASRRRRVAVAATVGLAAATAAAFAVVSTRAPSGDLLSVACFTAASTSSDAAIVRVVGDNPVETCRTLWVDDEMGVEILSREDAPTLVACVLETGPIGVFPTGSCDDVLRTPDQPAPAPVPTSPGREGVTPGRPDATGLPLPDFGAEDPVVREALQAVYETLLDRCLTLDAATRVTEDILARAGLDDWTVGPAFEHTDDTCAGFFPVVDERQVLLTPERPQPGQTPSDLPAD